MSSMGSPSRTAHFISGYVLGVKLRFVASQTSRWKSGRQLRRLVCGTLETSVQHRESTWSCSLSAGGRERKVGRRNS